MSPGSARDWTRACAALVVLLLASGVLAILLSPALLWLLGALGVASPDVVELVFRTLQLGAIALTPLLALLPGRGAYRTAPVWGLHPAAGALSRGLAGFAAGAGALAAVAVALWILDVREIRYDFITEPMHWVKVVVRALLAALVISVLEELWFRGGFYGALRRQGGVASAAVLTSVVYALSHFLGREDVVTTAEAAPAPTQALFASLARVFQDVDAGSAVALLAAGLWLSAMRQRQSDIIGAIGLHMGFVFVIKVFKKMTYINPDAPLRAVAGRYDDTIGWLAAAVLGTCAIWSWRRTIRQTA